MAMPASATFHYRIPVQPMSHAGARVWSGRATTLFPADQHPGLAGSEAAFELLEGVVSLRPASLDRPLRRFRAKGPRPRQVSFTIGMVLEELLKAGDVILLARDAMGALSLCVLREHELVLGLGALMGRPLPGDDDVLIEDDPRTEQRDDYWVAHQVRDQQAHIVWIDPEVEPVASSLRQVERLEAGRPLVVVYRNVEQRAFFTDIHPDNRTRRFGSTSFVRHPPFANIHEWRAYLEALPDRPPTDLRLHARCGTQHVRLAEGEEAELGPFIVRAEQVNWAIDWRRSTAAVIRQDPDADRAAFRQASAMFVSDPLRISDA